jgi:exonuclease SbcD
VPSSSTGGSLRLLHTSDIHVGWDDRAQQAVTAIVDMALGEAVDVVVIAGDLFDSSRVSAGETDQVIAQLSRLTMPTIVIPGNHDCIDAQSIYHRVDLSRAGHHLFFAHDPAGGRMVFEDLSLSIWARGIEDHDPSNRPLAGYEPAEPGYWDVVVVHGHYVKRGEPNHRSSPITQDELAQLDCHYVALGHWHRFVDVSENDTRACYPGSPSEPSPDGPTVNMVTLDPTSGVGIERRPLAG